MNALALIPPILGLFGSKKPKAPQVDWTTFNGKAAAVHNHAGHDLTPNSLTTIAGSVNAHPTSEGASAFAAFSPGGVLGFTATGNGTVWAAEAYECGADFVYKIFRLADGTELQLRFSGGLCFIS